jgi:hypothetical protein
MCVRVLAHMLKSALDSDTLQQIYARALIWRLCARGGDRGVREALDLYKRALREGKDKDSAVLCSYARYVPIQGLGFRV